MSVVLLIFMWSAIFYWSFVIFLLHHLDFVNQGRLGSFLGINIWKCWVSFVCACFYFTTSTYRSISLFILCNSWDEWVGLDRLLKFTEENVKKQQELNDKRGTDKKASRASQTKPKNGNRWFVKLIYVLLHTIWT